ncbi:hypothetical protein GCM10010230_25300 [Streptomyces narbonensis]|nr:hypothetical protein [Streptomyces narbonensis]GGV99361.1 hypothetical protein GCM10010230_25300 [Streptomyces narbonensis]
MADEVLDRLKEDPDAPSPVVRRLREVILEELSPEHVGIVAAFEREPLAPATTHALASILAERMAADPEFATRIRALLLGRLGSGTEDEQWAERHGGRPVSAIWFVFALALAFLVISAIAAFSGPPPDIP